MHKYLRAIGFSEIVHKSDAKELIEDIILRPSYYNQYAYGKEASLHQCDKYYDANIGISILGEWNDNEMPEVDYMAPFLLGDDITTCAPVEVEPLTEREGYLGLCEDSRVEISLIFNVQNVVEVKKELERKEQDKSETSVTLFGLSLGGTILFPVTKNQDQIENSKKQKANRNNLVALARKGDEQAMESLTLSDIDTYTDIARRIVKEDVFSLVDSYFMPYGIETDKYSVLGEILEYAKITNPITDEELYKLRIDVGDMQFDVCMKCEDLLGEPEAGRRFKGNIWLQGIINF